jgi:hypothetical protein
MLILGLGRLNVYQHAYGITFGVEAVYGLLMLALGLALLMTNGRKSRRPLGIAVSALGAGLLMTFGIDILFTAGNLNTSGLILLGLSSVLIIEAIATREC